MAPTKPEAGTLPSPITPSRHATKIRKACDTCRRKKERCNPTHHSASKNTTSSQPKSPPPASAAASISISTGTTTKTATRSRLQACDTCRRKKARCNPSHHTEMPAFPVDVEAERLRDPDHRTFHIPASWSPDYDLHMAQNPDDPWAVYMAAQAERSALDGVAYLPRKAPRKARAFISTTADAPISSTAPSPEQHGQEPTTPQRRSSLLVTFQVDPADLAGHKTASPQLPLGTSRAASSVPAAAMPAEPAMHGDSTRQYINMKIAPHVMEGMKNIVRNRPEDPCRVLGNFLLARAALYEPESSANAGPSVRGGGHDNNDTATKDGDGDDMEEDL